MNNDIITIDHLLLSLYESPIHTEIVVEKIDDIYNRILFVDYSKTNMYNLSMDILWELYYLNGYIKIIQETKISNKALPISKMQQVFSLSDKGKEYIKFKYPKKKP